MCPKITGTTPPHCTFSEMYQYVTGVHAICPVCVWGGAMLPPSVAPRRSPGWSRIPHRLTWHFPRGRRSGRLARSSPRCFGSGSLRKSRGEAERRCRPLLRFCSDSFYVPVTPCISPRDQGYLRTGAAALQHGFFRHRWPRAAGKVPKFSLLKCQNYAPDLWNVWRKCLSVSVNSFFRHCELN